MAKHLDFRTDRYKKGDIILRAGSVVTDIGLVLSGSVPIEYILSISVPRLFTPCPVCRSQNRLIQNLVIISAEKNLQLSRRSMHTSPKAIRERLFSYFSQQVSAQRSNKIVIPFDRQQLADYLNLDRSALSKELGKMRKDGLIEFHKNSFVIKTDME